MLPAVPGAALCALLFAMCAGSAPPPGGPPDMAPPQIVRTYPDTNQVNVHPDRIELEFDEYVDRRTAEESIFISPYVGQLIFDWSGTELTVTFTDSLRGDVTYVVSVGTDVVDIRAGNRMARAFSLAFATGDTIDRAAIEGRLFDSRPEGVMVFAYGLRHRDADTLDPARLRADYITQTGKDGRYFLSNLAFGAYRIVAVRDEYRNLIYERDVDQYGVTSEDITLSPDRPVATADICLLAREDSTRPFLGSATVIDDHNLRLVASEPLDSASFESSQISITDTLTGEPVRIRVGTLERPKRVVMGLVTADTLRRDRTYRLQAFGLRDLSGNPMDSSQARVTFAGAETPDTTRPLVSVTGLADDARNVRLDRPVVIRFSEPVEQMRALQAVTLSDTLGTPARVVKRWEDPLTLVLTPVAGLVTRQWYRLDIPLDSVVDYQGNRHRDSTLSLRFQALDLRTTGTIVGNVIDERPGFRGGPVHLTAKLVESPAPDSVAIVLSGERFTLESLVEGRYRLSAFMDADSSGAYTPGRPFPFAPSERFAVFPDTVKVRARWSVENVPLKFR